MSANRDVWDREFVRVGSEEDSTITFHGEIRLKDGRRFRLETRRFSGSSRRVWFTLNGAVRTALGLKNRGWFNDPTDDVECVVIFDSTGREVRVVYLGDDNGT